MVIENKLDVGYEIEKYILPQNVTFLGVLYL